LNLKTCGAVAAFAALVVIAPGVSAQGTAGKGALGGILGVPFFLADEDTKNGQSPRILAQGQFQYAFTPKTRVAIGAGFGWIGYKEGTVAPYRMFHPGLGDSVQVMDDVLTKFQPITVSLLRSFRDQGKGWVPYAGGGVNLTRIEIVNDRRKIKDPATFDSYVNWAPGVQAQGGFEYFLGSNQNVSFDGHARLSKLFSKDEEKFPSGFTGPHTYFSVNFGVNVYFWPIGHKPIETAPAPAPEAIAPEAPASPDTTVAPDTTIVPPSPPPPTPGTPDTTVVPDTTVTPDTTLAPGSRQSSLVRPSAKTPPAAATPAPAAGRAVSTTGSPADEPAICPLPTSSDEVVGGMFGVPGVPGPAAPPRREDAPPEEPGRPGPEGSATP
jgi:hypothetical protein